MQQLFQSLLRIAQILKQQMRVFGSIRVVPKIIHFLLRSIVLVAPISFVRFLGSEGIAIITEGQNLVIFSILILGLLFMFRLYFIRSGLIVL